MTRPSGQLPAREDGFTLVESLVVMAVAIVVLLATLQTLDAFSSNQARQSRVVDANDQARRTMDQIVREVRNASGILRAGPNDLVFASLDYPNTPRYDRVCLAASGGLYRERSTTTDDPGGSCPSTVAGWSGGKTTTMASTNSATAPLFRYDKPAAASVRSIGLTFSLDATSGGRPGGSTLRASAFLRRQVERPPVVAPGDIQATCTPSGPLLNFGLLTNLVNGPVSVVANGLVPSGGALQLTNSVSSVVATITNAVGLTTVVTKDVKCNS